MTDPTAQELLKKGIAAAKAARHKETPPAQIEARRRQARSLLARVLKQDQHNVPAWLWLSTVVDRPEEQAACFKNVLAVDPENKHAREGPQIGMLQCACVNRTPDSASRAIFGVITCGWPAKPST